MRYIVYNRWTVPVFEWTNLFGVYLFMAVDRKNHLLGLSAFFRLRLVHAAIVDGFECHAPRASMAVNRLLMVSGDDGRGESVLRDLSTGREMVMRANHYYFIPCDHVVGLDIVPSLRFQSLQFNLDLFYGFDIFVGRGRCETSEDPALVAEVRDWLDREDELGSLCRVEGLLFRLSAEWLGDQPVDIQRRAVASRKYGQALDHARRFGDATTTVEELADMLGMRPDVFSRKFVADLGVTPRDFLANALMRKASQLLMTPGATVRSVAGELKFSSEYYFSRFFKRLSGQPPTLFQRQHRAR